MITPKNAMDKFEKFKSKEKFIEEAHYPGIDDAKMRPILTQKINAVADNFKIVSQEENPTDTDYQNQIEKGLESFKGIYLDTEDSERVCSYFEELMYIVGLDSSDGQLNDFLYDFDPNKIKKQ